MCGFEIDEHSPQATAGSLLTKKAWRPMPPELVLDMT